MLGIEFEIVDTLGCCVQGIGILVSDAVELEHGHVVIVPDRSPDSGVVRRSSEQPEVQILAITKATARYAAALYRLPPMSQMGLDVHAVSQRYGD